MTDFDGGAAAPADSVSASNDADAAPPNPISTEREPLPAESNEPEAKEPAKPISTREALEKAAAKVEADDKPAPKAKDVAEPKAKDDKDGKDAKEPAKDGPVRDETGKFAPKDGTEKPAEANEAAKPPDVAPKASTAASDAPARFSPDAKAAWTAAPEPVKAEVARMERELTQGLEKYKASHEAYEQVRQYDEMAKANGRSLKQALDTYVHLDRLIGQDPIKGLEALCEAKGMTLRQVAEHVLGQPADQQANARDSEIVSLKNTIRELQQQIGGVTNTLQEQHQAKVHESVQQFAASKPRFDELADDIAFFLKSGKTNDLAEAYALAERLNPAPASAPQPAPDPAPDSRAAAQTRGAKSITGAPSAGSDPVKRQPSSSIRDALKRAAAAAS